MDSQLSQDYSVDSRYRGLKSAQDANAAKKFVNNFLQQIANKQKLSLDADSAREDRFLIAGPGDSKYTFRNGFRG